MGQESGVGSQESAGAVCISEARCSVRRTKYPVLRTRRPFWLALFPLVHWLFCSSLFAAQPDALLALATKCDELGLKHQAAITRNWQVSRHAGRHYLFIPAAVDPIAPKATAGMLVRQWYDKFLELRRERAASLFDAVKQASTERQPARAFQLLHEVLREDPDHAEARRILGYIKNARGTWTTPELEKLVVETARLNHPQFGWRAGAYFRLETPHYQIVTDHSKPEALEAGEQLENLHTLWRQIFFRYWSTPEALAARLAGGNQPLARPQAAKMQVVLFKNRQEYTEQLLPSVPQAAATLGIYQDRVRTAFFFGGDQSVYPTWYHEAAHQLFQESVPQTANEPGLARNFWAVEGAALYLESLAQHDGYWTAGGCEADRLQLARYRGLSGDFRLPSQRLAALSREAIQKDPDIRKIYAQSAGLAQFLIDGADGKYRDAFIDLLTAIYRDLDTPDSLATLTGQPFAALDEQYLKFLNVTDADVAGIASPAKLKNLCLGRTAVTDAGLARLTGCENLQWLDLTATAASDAGLRRFADAKNIKQLFLEGTQVTAASLPLIAGFKQLQELDVARLPLADNALAPLASLKNLKSLYLSGTPLTDGCLVHLRGLKQLELLDTEGTQITPAGINRLKASLPKLK